MASTRIGEQDREFVVVFQTPGLSALQSRAGQTHDAVLPQPAPRDAVGPSQRNKRLWVVAPQRSRPAQLATVLSNLGLRITKPESATIESIRSRIEGGFGREAFNRLKTVLAVPSGRVSHVIRIPERTLARRTTFKPDESERLLRLASAFHQSIEVLGSLDAARRWFKSPKRALGGRTPLEFCDTEPGAEEVRNLLGRVEQGVFT